MLHCCDHIFWTGDLNYRINCGRYGTLEEFENVVKKAQSGNVEDLEWLISKDQLLNERKAGRVFAHFHNAHFQPQIYLIVDTRML